MAAEAVEKSDFIVENDVADDVSFKDNLENVRNLSAKTGNKVSNESSTATLKKTMEERSRLDSLVRTEATSRGRDDC